MKPKYPVGTRFKTLDSLFRTVEAEIESVHTTASTNGWIYKVRIGRDVDLEEFREWELDLLLHDKARTACDCAAEKLGHPGHSHWCSTKNKVDWGFEEEEFL